LVADVMTKASSASSVEWTTVAAAAGPSSPVDVTGVDNPLFSFTQALATFGNAGAKSQSKGLLSAPLIKGVYQPCSSFARENVERTRTARCASRPFSEHT